MSSPGVASRPLPTDGPSAGGDELDDLFDYEGGMDDPFSENYKPPVTSKQTTNPTAARERSGAGLGIDEEVEVTRKPRAPRVKLDEHRLLSAAGIPKLRKRARDHLKFKGKGHEFSDAARLLGFYQLWLDDLFPKARFLDALAMVEKMGHKKVMQAARMEWINEGKPHSSVHEDSLFDEPALPPRQDVERENTASRIAPIFEKPTTERPKTPAQDPDAEENDLYDATPKAIRRNPEDSVPQTGSIFGPGAASIFGPQKNIVADDGPPEDDLDALLAEEEMMQMSAKAAQPPPGPSNAAAPRDDFDDDMEAMAEMDMDGMW
ncbi:Uncharacterized protein BP5553_01588 [Venustampulla echinocandica]|uniref:Chromosome segregation in meiosis protein n=1 Tax=Venustampulla echinocandica TaxID=2656787 RepID=A0A370U1F2_9HELO|nr:Uncharacterized protein BP5553_01588 [Venustampulla echinocandica]RDL41609.1 Uncharacterized protein BP5553_01588 [Venustampulla echinocandica]